jgi:hypothetical protein
MPTPCPRRIDGLVSELKGRLSPAWWDHNPDSLTQTPIEQDFNLGRSHWSTLEISIRGRPIYRTGPRHFTRLPDRGRNSLDRFLNDRNVLLRDQLYDRVFLTLRLAMMPESWGQAHLLLCGSLP